MLEGIGLKKYFPVTSGVLMGRVRGWIKAVDGVQVHVAEGEALGIVGESGSGKTTLAKLFLLLEQPTDGSLLFDGQEVRTFRRPELARYRRAVQAVFQDPYSSLNPRMRVENIVAEPLPPEEGFSRAVIRERVAEVLELVGLSRDSANLYPHEFSGGQRQRIAIARALVTYPKFIILDEPVSALDVSIRAQILNLLKSLQDRLRLAYVMIAHDLAAARYLSTRLTVMYAGKVVETGDCDEVYTTPRHPYTQALLSAALPLHPSLRRQRMILPGEVPNPLNPPTGCRFHPRCPQAMPQCQTQEPVWKEVSSGHFAACHLY
ncbi:MAG TPA: oligopeptide/dipeptide ABC transporter ATP-binding protein [Candidatus Tectomicrobia bacterium]|nr:oligopeptide/dipeptide ABC transporter ATP-binding protein [Candidatus Tectomicrobia bacterium]